MPRDIRVNLLPWREALRHRKKREFLALLVLMPVLAAMMIGGFDRYYASAIQRQGLSNNFLAREIEVLEVRIGEVELLRQQQEQLIARMAVVQTLQGHRARVVRVFDELARQVTPGVFFTELALKTRVEGGMEDEVITITGIAESNDRISHLLRNFSASPWFDRSNVTAIKADPGLGPQASRFTLRLVCSGKP